MRIVEDFVHRCGRTGRAGKTGKAVTFFTGENHERSLAGEFMRVLRDVNAEIPQEMDRFPSTIKKKGKFTLRQYIFVEEADIGIRARKLWCFLPGYHQCP